MQSDEIFKLVCIGVFGAFLFVLAKYQDKYMSDLSADKAAYYKLKFRKTFNVGLMMTGILIFAPLIVTPDSRKLVTIIVTLLIAALFARSYKYYKRWKTEEKSGTNVDLK